MGVIQSKIFSFKNAGRGNQSTGVGVLDDRKAVNNQSGGDPFMNILPADLLGELLELVLNGHQLGTRRIAQLTTLRLVAKGWNHFLETSPSVWTEIDLTYPPQSTQKHLQRSGDCLLAVVTSPYPSPSAKRSYRTGTLKHLLLGDAGRIQTLTISEYATENPSVAALLGQSLPALQSLKCSAGPHLDSRLVTEFLVRHINQLQTLNLDFPDGQSFDCEFPDDVSRLPLKHLEVAGSWEATLPLLVKSLNLTSLAIMSPRSLLQQSDPSSTMITLPNLLNFKLYLRDTNPRLIFDRFRMPQLEELRVVLAMYIQPAILSHLLRLIVLGAPATSPISITLQRDPHEIKIQTERLLLIMETRSTHRIWDLLDQAAEEIFAGRRISVLLEGERLYLLYGRFKRLSAWITEITWRRLKEFDTDCRILERKERYHMSDGTLLVQWSLPRLQRLTLSPIYKTRWRYNVEDPQSPIDVINVLRVLRARSVSPARALQRGDPAPRVSICFVERKRYDDLSPKLKEDLRKVTSRIIVG